jgi:hypothetical protein
MHDYTTSIALYYCIQVSVMHEEKEKNDDRDRHAEQPEQDSAPHGTSPCVQKSRALITASAQFRSRTDVPELNH